MADLDRHTSELVQQLASEVHANLVEATPIDIGWARANWVPSVGAPVVTQPITAPESSDVQIQLGRVSAAQAQILTYSIADGPVFIANNVPYIRRLDDGWSSQAPAGFVKAAIEQAVRSVAR